MKSVAYKWRISTNKYAYLTSVEYNHQNPNYTLGGIFGLLPEGDEQIIRDKVRKMSSIEYKNCFNHVLYEINNDEDGKYLNLYNWEYYYNFVVKENEDNKELFVSATAYAENSDDSNAYANVNNRDGVLNFTFKIPVGKDGVDGKDGLPGLPGEPGRDGLSVEYIYKQTETEKYENYYPETWINEDSYNQPDFVPKKQGWTDKPFGISEEKRFEWVSIRKKNGDEWGIFEEPALMSRWGEDGKDGDGIEYVYKTTKNNIKPTKPTIPENWEDKNSIYQTTKEYAIHIAHEGWYDTPQGVNEYENKFEWVSIRKQIDGKWGQFSSPALWTNWGKDGKGIEYIYLLNNDNTPPIFDDYDIHSKEYQTNNYLPTTNSIKWFDNFITPTYEQRFSWISNRKTNEEGEWGEFSKPTLFNTYKVGGKSFVDLYTRSNFRLRDQDLPTYNGNIYYSFRTDKYYSNTGMTSEITSVTSTNGTVWSVDIPSDNTSKMLFKASALVEIKDNLDEIITIPQKSWYGPYLVSSNGENAISTAPYVVLDDDSLSIPIKQDTKKPHEPYQYSFNANLYYGDNIVNINEYIISSSDVNKVVIINNEKNEDNTKINISFNINNSFEFTSIELIYVTLKGEYEGKEIEGVGQFKIIPFISEDAIIYKILLNQDAIFVPNEPCINENGEGVWKTILETKVVDNKGNEIDIPNTNDHRIVYESKNGELINIPKSGLTLIGCTEKENNEQLIISDLPNPLKIIYQVNGKTREIEHVNFTNMPLNGIDGISSRLVFAYCSLNEGETPDTPTGGTVDFETNEITEYPKGVYTNNDGEERGDVQWGDTNNLNGVIWLSQCQYFNDGTQDLTWTKPIRISGEKGEKPYHVELSNDMDQIYITDDIIVYSQTVSTIVSLFNGDEKTLLDKDSIQITSKEGIFKNIHISNVNNSSNTDVNVELITETGITITGKTIDVDLTILGESYGKSYNFVKTFKLNVLNGTKDYDLDVTPTFIKKNKKNIYSTNEVVVNVTERDITTNSKAINKLTSLPSNIYIEYFYNDDNEKIFKINSGEELGYKIPIIDVNGYENNIEKITINLYKNNICIDQTFVECVSDGIDGISPYHIELSNDFDQVLTTNNSVIYPQTITTVLSVYCGENIIEASASDIICDYNDELFTLSALTESGKYISYQIDPKTGSTLEQNKTYDFDFIVGTNTTNLNYEISKKFKIIALNGTKDYDLTVVPTVIKKTNIGYSNSAITIHVKETDISRTDRQINKLTKLEEYGLTVECYKEGVDELDIKYNENGIEILPINYPEKFLYVKLLSGTTLIDEAYIDIVSDGINGENGKDGTNIEFIYKLYSDESEFNADKVKFNINSSKNELLLSGWTDSPSGISEDKQIEACSQHVKEAGAKEFSDWCTPFIWAKWGDDGIDGDGAEYIFQITDRENNPLNPGTEINNKLNSYTGNILSALTEIVNTYDFFPGEKWINNNTETINVICNKYNLDINTIKTIVDNLDLNWTDDPMDVGPYEPIEWVSIRRKKVSLDGTFEYLYTNPTIWAEWKRDTYDSVTEFMFAIDSRDLSKCTVNGGTWKDIKDGTVYSSVTTSVFEDVKWSDSVPNHNALVQNVWMVRGFASGEIIYTGGTIDVNGGQIPTGITYSEINWTSPTKLIDSQLMQVEYSCDTSGRIPSPVSLNRVIENLGVNYTLPDLEIAFRELDKETNGHDFEWVDVPESGNTPTWMITSTFQNNKWSDWVVSKIKGEQGPQGENGQSIRVKGSFDNLEQLKNAYSYYLTQSGEKPLKYFNDNKLTIGDSYIVNEAEVNGETVYGYLFVYIKEDNNFEEAWEGVGQIKGDSSYIYIIYADSVTINEDKSKTYFLTTGGKDDKNREYFGTTPGKYIGIHIATQQYEGHPYPPKLYSASTITDTDKTFLWNKWSGDDGFGQEQIFILGNETAPDVPKYENYSANTTIDEWNSSDYTPDEWNDVPLTPDSEKRYCWMATRRFPSNDSPNNFKGDINDKAILFTYLSKDGKDGTSSYHVELSNEFDLISTLNGKVNGEQIFTTNIALYEGDICKTISSITIENNNGWEFETGKTEDNIYYVKNIFANGESFTDPINPVIKVNGKYNGYVTIKPIEGVALYQLESNVGFVVEGKPTDITVSVKQKTNEGLIDVTDLPDGMGIYVYLDNATSAYTSGTSYSLIYNYDGDSSINEIDFRLVKNGTVYDNINIEVKNDIKAFGSLNLNPLEKIVYVNDDNKPMVSSITFDASFIYEGEQIDLTNVNVIVKNSKTTDFQDTVDKTTSSITVNYKNDVSIQNLTKEKYILESTYSGDTYQNEFYVTYIKHSLDISSDSDTIYVPENTNSTISRKLGINVIRSGANITNDVELLSTGVTSSVTFNQRSGVWYANIPSDICKNVEITQLPVIVSYSGLNDNIKYTIIRGGKNDEYWYINVSPKYLFTGSTIELYLTKNSYDGDYISLESAKSNNVNLYYIIDGGEEINYTSQLENAPKLHGNNVFYSDGYITGTTENNEFKPLYTQEPVYTSIEFRLYYENNDVRKLLSSEIVERYDILKNSEIKKINAHGLIINATDIFEEYNNNDYDIVIKPVK